MRKTVRLILAAGQLHVEHIPNARVLLTVMPNPMKHGHRHAANMALKHAAKATRVAQAIVEEQTAA